MPSSRPSASRTGPPEEPGSSCAVCSRLPVMRRPRGPRNARSTPETNPNVTRSPRPPGLDRANTGVPIAADAPSAHDSAGPPPVSTSTTARSPSLSCPATLPPAVPPAPRASAARARRPGRAGVGGGDGRGPAGGGGAGGRGLPWAAAGVDLDDGEVAVDVLPGHAALGRPPVGEGDRDLIAAARPRAAWPGRTS